MTEVRYLKFHVVCETSKLWNNKEKDSFENQIKMFH